jgi:hypothetical protein
VEWQGRAAATPSPHPVAGHPTCSAVPEGRGGRGRTSTWQLLVARLLKPLALDMSVCLQASCSCCPPPARCSLTMHLPGRRRPGGDPHTAGQPGCHVAGSLQPVLSSTRAYLPRVQAVVQGLARANAPPPPTCITIAVMQGCCTSGVGERVAGKGGSHTSRGAP